jgi:hypothetical protein
MALLHSVLQRWFGVHGGSWLLIIVIGCLGSTTTTTYSARFSSLAVTMNSSASPCHQLLPSRTDVAASMLKVCMRAHCFAFGFTALL